MTIKSNKNLDHHVPARTNAPTQAIVIPNPQVSTEEFTRRRRRFPAEPLAALRTRAPARDSASESVYDSLERWNGFEEWCDHRKWRALPASEQGVLQFTTERVEQHSDQQARACSVESIAQDLQVIACVHRYLGYADPCRRALADLKERIEPLRTSTPERRAELPQALSTSARKLSVKGSQCIVALIYSLHLTAADLVTLRIEDYQRGTPGNPSSLRLSSPITHRRKYQQPLSQVLARIIEEWIEATGLKSGFLICDTRRSHLGHPLTPQFIAWTLRTSGPGGRPTCVRALHRRLFQDAFSGSNLELTGLRPCRRRGVRAIEFGASHARKPGRVVCERPAEPARN